MIRNALPTGLALFCALAGPGRAEEDRYIGVFVGSQHIGSDEYNDFNPGLTYGRRWGVGTGGTEVHVEGGVFYNSYREVSPIVVAGVSTRVARIGPGDLRLGASLGMAYYKELSEVLEAKYDFPSVGGFLPVAAVTGAYRVRNVEYRLSVLPYGDDVDGVVNFSFAVSF